MLKESFDEKSFLHLAFDLYKESARVLEICSHAHTGYSPEKCVLARNQAICAGLLVRISKFMTAVLRLVSHSSDCADVVFSLNRSIIESDINLRFLLKNKNESRFFDQFVCHSLAPERELHDSIQKNIAERDGKILPIERRMLQSIDRVCQFSGVAITDIQSKKGDWGGGLKNRLINLGEAESYVGVQRIPSHAVHGTWVDIFQHHLTVVDNGFQPDLTWSSMDSRLMLPICMRVLVAAQTYINAFFPSLPEFEPLLERITDLQQRIVTADNAHEEWLSNYTQDDE